MPLIFIDDYVFQFTNYRCSVLNRFFLIADRKVRTFSQIDPSVVLSSTLSVVIHTKIRIASDGRNKNDDNKKMNEIEE